MTTAISGVHLLKERNLWKRVALAKLLSEMSVFQNCPEQISLSAVQSSAGNRNGQQKPKQNKTIFLQLRDFTGGVPSHSFR